MSDYCFRLILLRCDCIINLKTQIKDYEIYNRDGVCSCGKVVKSGE